MTAMVPAPAALRRQFTTTWKTHSKTLRLLITKVREEQQRVYKKGDVFGFTSV